MKLRQPFHSEDIPVFEFHIIIIEMVNILKGIVVELEMNHRRQPIQSGGLEIIIRLNLYFRHSSISGTGRAVDIVHYPVQLRVG